MSDSRKLLGNKSQKTTATVRIPITGIPSSPNEKAEEIGQFLGGTTPFHAFSEMDSKRANHKHSVFQSLMAKMIKLPSNAGRQIEIKKDSVASALSPSHIITTYANSPWQATKLIYSSLIPVPRRAEDFILMHQPINTVIQTIGLTAELPLKILGSAFSHPINSWLRFRKEVTEKLPFDKSNWLKRIGAEIGFLAISPVLALPWVAGQVLNTAGNLVSYGREMVDSVAQGISSTLSIATGRYGTEHPKLGTSIKNFCKNALLTLGGGIPLLSGTINSAVIAVKKAVASEPVNKQPIFERETRRIVVAPKQQQKQSTALMAEKLYIQEVLASVQEKSPLINEGSDDEDDKHVTFVTNPLVFNDYNGDDMVSKTSTASTSSDSDSELDRKPGVGPSQTFNWNDDESVIYKNAYSAPLPGGRLSF